jgi:hypothetical protein
MATTTTYAAIRDEQIRLLEALTPSSMSDKPFRRASKRDRLRKWAAKTPSTAALRRFEISRGPASDAPIVSTGASQTIEMVGITVAYPVLPSLYGSDELDDLDEVMRADAAQIRDALFSIDSYIAGHSITRVEIEAPDRGLDTVWFQDFTATVAYTEARTWATARTQAILVTDPSGSPLTGLSPTWSCLWDVRTGVAPAQPAITEVGSTGLYRTAINEGLAGIVDMGATAEPRYVLVDSTLSHYHAIAAYDVVTGAPLALLNPTWSAVVTTATGDAATPQPAFSGLGGGVYVITGLSPGLAGIADLGATADPRYLLVEGKVP